MTDKILIDRSVLEQALEALNASMPHNNDMDEDWPSHIAARRALRAALEQPKQTLKDAAMKAGITISDTYIPSMEDAIAAGDSVLINEQATLLRECRLALNSLIKQKPTLAGLRCGSTTLGNLKADLYAYRPRGVMGTSELEQPAEQEPVAWMTEDGRIATDATKQWGMASTSKPNFNIPLFTHPQPPRQPLADEQIEDICWTEVDQRLRSFARAIERAHGIGGKA